MQTRDVIVTNITAILKEDRRSVLILLFYSMLEALLALTIPLSSSFVINSVMAHAAISVAVLGFIILSMFGLITVVQVIREYIIEKFQQKIFLTTGIKVATQALEHPIAPEYRHKYMNYFFDVLSIQKFFPILLLDGAGVIFKILVSLLLLIAFDPLLFGVGLLFFTLYFLLIFWLGRNGVARALERSNAKHEAIYTLQSLNDRNEPPQHLLEEFDTMLGGYVKARDRLFRIVIRQEALTFFAEGVIFSAFMLIGGYLVINGPLPLGEFIAAEIVIVSITYALKSFVKQFDYIYDTLEGFYKIHKLSDKLSEAHHA